MRFDYTISNLGVYLILDSDESLFLPVEFLDSTLKEIEKLEPPKCVACSIIDWNPKIGLPEGVRLGIKEKVIKINEISEILDLTNRGFANIMEGTNLLTENYPAYWEFLKKLRIERGDPHIV